MRRISVCKHLCRLCFFVVYRFALSEENRLTHLIECKLSDKVPHRALIRFANQFAAAEAVQIVYELRQEEHRAPVHILHAANWLGGLAA